jgi:4'-phosphopantetheinyl transferase
VTALDGLRTAWRTVPRGTPRREVAWALLRELVGDVPIANPCPFCGGPHGPVQLPGSPWRASVSYAGDLAVVGVVPSAGIGAFGLDAEDVAKTGDLDLRAWTRVEAALKADGRGIRVDPETVVVTTHPDGWTAVVPGPDAEPRVYRGRDAAAPDRVLIGVAVREDPGR